MLFQHLATLALYAALAAANSVTFVSLDDINRTIYWTPSVPNPQIAATRIPARATVRVDIPDGWYGNCYSVSDGKPNVPGMLGEVTFQGWNDLTYFDVSAIVNPNDHEGIQMMYPAQNTNDRSGCNPFPCNNAYYLPDDVQTKTTTETDLICTLGSGYIAKRETEVDAEAMEVRNNVKHDFVLGKM
jgi:hypothetical protein